MTIQSRLERMKAYREEAMKKPKANKLYIEDLDISIAMFEKHADSKLTIQSGWLDSEEDDV